MDKTVSFDAVLFPADERPPLLIPLMTSNAFTFPPPGQSGSQPLPHPTTRVPHPRMYMDHIAEGVGARAWKYDVPEMLDGMNRKFANPYVIFYPVLSRDGVAFPINKCLKEIQGANYHEGLAWRGDVVIAKYRDEQLSALVNVTMADIPLLMSYLSTHYSPAVSRIQPYYLGYGDPDLPGSYFDHHLFNRYPDGPMDQSLPPDSTAMLSTQYATMWDAQGSLGQAPVTFPIILSTDSTTPRVSGGGSAVVSAQSVGMFPAQTQPAHSTYTEKVMRTRELVPQETFRLVRQQKEPWDSQDIEFSAHGGKGVRLSDALDGNWGGFEGRDDRSLFGNNRLQIIIRLRPNGCPSWHSKIFTTDHTAMRRPITRMKLAHQVAKAVRKFIARERANGHNGDHSRCKWKDTLMEDIYLTRLVRVSAASWQPEIFVEPPSPTTSPGPSSSRS